MHEFMENLDGVHLMNGEHTLCGDAFDAHETEPDWESGVLVESKRRTVTCPRCCEIIKLCRNVRISCGGV